LSITLNRLGDWPLPIIGGRLRIARNPYQGIFCSRGQKTLKNSNLQAIFGCALKAQKAGPKTSPV